MKKVLYFLTLSLICICIVGCKNEEDLYSNYVHSDLSDVSYYEEHFMHDKKNTSYVLARISDREGEFGNIGGLYYKIAPNDYILLDKFHDARDNFDKKSYYYNGNELYVLLQFATTITKYTLNGVDTKIDEIKINVNEIFDAEITRLLIESIDNIDKDNIYLTISYTGYTDNKPVSSDNELQIKCSLETYNCSKI